MPHLPGDPLQCMSSNQLRVFKAYGSVPVWLDSFGSLQCTYCNSGIEGCLDSCLMSSVMNKMRADVNFLDSEEARKGSPVTAEDMSDRFHQFCHSADVQALVSGDRLFADFVEKHQIISVLQNLGPWLKKEADRYASAGGVHHQSKDRLSLKCERAVSRFLRLDLESMVEEDTIILCNAIETSGFYNLDPSKQGSIQCVLDLLSVVNAVKETQRSNAVSLFQQLQDEQEQEKLLPPHIPQPVSVANGEAQAMAQPLVPENSPSSFENKSPPMPMSPAKTGLLPRAKLPKAREQNPLCRKRPRELIALSFDDSDGFFLDDPSAPNRCHGRTKAGVRCKLTEESVGKLHGRCAAAAEPLTRGAKYCKFHRDQEPLF